MVHTYTSHFPAECSNPITLVKKTEVGERKGLLAPFCLHCASTAMKAIYLKQKAVYSSLLLFGQKSEVYCFLDYITHYFHTLIPLLCDSLLGFFTILFKFQGHAA